MPAYVYASRDDHIVPWRSAYRTTALLGGDVTFVLGASGHIAGVINPPDKQRRNYWTNELITDDAGRLARARRRACRAAGGRTGAWLAAHGGAMKPAPREAGQCRVSAAGRRARTLRASRPANRRGHRAGALRDAA